MRILLMFLLCLSFVVTPVSALEIQAPAVPEEGMLWMPEKTDSFADGLMELIGNVINALIPELRTAGKTAAGITALILVLSVLEVFSDRIQNAVRIAGAGCIALVLLQQSGTMISLAVQTVQQIGDYGKLLLPVMTAALAAQGAITSSAALYAGTAVFDVVLTNLISHLLLPGLWIYLTLCTVSAALGENMLKQMADLFRSVMTWLLKCILTVFTTYLGITGVVSGTTDAAALKATRVTISTVVPVVGGILSAASEAVLVSAGLLKNGAGIYGILAVLALFLHPFSRIAIHYLVLKLTAGLCGLFGKKELTALISDYACAMGLLLAMTGTGCLMTLISTVCFMRGVTA